jgi:type IV secretion system protein VirB3
VHFKALPLLLLPIVILVMRQIAKQDELIFRILGLRWQFKFKARHREELPDMWVFSPNAYRDKPPAA